MQRQLVLPSVRVITSDMSNLLPLHIKKELKNERKIRLWSAGLLYLTGSVFAIIVLLFPSYFLTRAELESEQHRAEVLRREDKPLTEAERANITELNSRIATLIINEKVSFSDDIVDRVLAVIPRDVTLRLLNIDETKEGDIKVSFEGTSPTREKLLEYTDKLKGIKYVKSIDIPVSNYVKGTNLEFTLSMRFEKIPPKK